MLEGKKDKDMVRRLLPLISDAFVCLFSRLKGAERFLNAVCKVCAIAKKR